MDTAVVVMAAGVGSRFGEGIKQLESMGPHGESIMEYSIHDAIEAGFNRVIFILRKAIEEEFRSEIGARVESVCARLGVKVDYAFQRLEDLPEGIRLPEGRKKPWGTGQAVLACRDLIDCPFVVINADDYYGKKAFREIHRFLEDYRPEEPNSLCMAGFILKNTLSDVGGVTRGICHVKGNYLTDIKETYSVEKRIGADGELLAVTGETVIDADSRVSMNMWGLTPQFVDHLKAGFAAFFKELDGDPERELKAEYLLPIYINQLLQKGIVSVKVLETTDKWFGVTYHDDKAAVTRELHRLIAEGVYQEDLFADL